MKKQTEEQTLLTDADLDTVAGGAQGLDVVVAAATTETATPHAISVVEGREP